jgi:hypothetical protein
VILKGITIRALYKGLRDHHRQAAAAAVIVVVVGTCFCICHWGLIGYALESRMTLFRNCRTGNIQKMSESQLPHLCPCEFVIRSTRTSHRIISKCIISADLTSGHQRFGYVTAVITLCYSRRCNTSQRVSHLWSTVSMKSRTPSNSIAYYYLLQ